MHLFVVHQFPDYDNFVPIVINLKKKIESNFSIINIFPVHDLKYYGFNSLLEKYKIELIDVFKINKKSILINILLSIIKIFPNTIIKKLNRIWYYFYHKYTLFNTSQLVNLIKNKKIKSINIDESLPEGYKKIISLACKETKIKFICYRIGIEMRKDIRLTIDDYNMYDNTIIQDENLNLDHTEENEKKFIRIANQRYSLDWLDEVEVAYRYKLKEYFLNREKKKLKVLLVTRPMFSNKSWQMILEKLKTIKNIELRIKFKPRGQFRPLHTQENIINEYNTSELVNWSDVIVSHSSSILMEAIIKNKRILFCNFLFALEGKKEIKYIFEDYDIVEYVNKIEDLINKIQQFDRIKINLYDNENYQKSKKIFLEKNLGNDFFSNKNIFKKEFTDIYQN